MERRYTTRSAGQRAASARKRRQRRYRTLRIVFPVSMAVVILFSVVVCASFIFHGVGVAAGVEPESSAQSEDTQTTTGASSADESEAETSQTEITPPKAPAGAVVPASDPVDDTYFKDAAFIGDSRTEGLMLYTGLDATFYTAKGLMVNTFFTKPVVRKGEDKVTIPEAMEDQQFGKVYIMLGINELGWSYSSVFKKTYGDLIDKVRELQPGAVIYIQSLLPVTREKSEADAIYNNPKIQEYNELLLELAKEKQVCYLNVQESVALDNGALPKEASTDGIHLDKPYCEKWLDYLKSHTVK